MNRTQYLYPEWVRTGRGAGRAVWTRSSGLEARVDEEGKGFRCCLPARHGSQIGSGFCFDLSTKPSTRSYLTRCLTLSRFRWARRRYYRERSMIQVLEKFTDSDTWMVEPSRRAVL